MNPLQALREQGQSIWLDYIRRSMTRGGGLTRMIADDGLRGMTSNPAIFQQSIAGSDDYADDLLKLARDPELDSKAVYEAIAIADIRDAADALRTVYDESEGADGYVSLEVSPSLAHDAEGTGEEARRLWRTVDRPNVMIKVPGTEEGLVAIFHLLSEGINVNITLLFSQSAYAKVADAYVRALEARAARGLPLAAVASVASFFVSRIDSEVDDRLNKLIAASDDEPTRTRLRNLRGKAAIANAKVAYADVFAPLVASPRWQALVAKGARPQRMLWASTGTKNPDYPDVLYIDELIGPDTVNTAPPKTIDAFRDHGKVTPSLLTGVPEARAALAGLAEAGIDLTAVTDVLLSRGLDLFRDAMDGLLETVAAKQRAARGPRLNRISFALPASLGDQMSSSLSAWDKQGNTERLWRRDASLWTGADEAKWLGWLDIVEEQRKSVGPLARLANEIRGAGIRHVLLLGMGGSSLCADVLTRTYGAERVAKGWPRLDILDSTVAQQVERATVFDPKHTLYVVASKSGTTLEPKAFLELCLHRAKQQVGAAAGQHFIAITDPGSKLEAQAKAEKFREIFAGVPEIGGRYSALSNFGLVPAALMGLAVDELLVEAATMTQPCKNAPVAADNPGVALGVALGVAALAGRDKLTIVASPQIASLGAWIEQLVDESTGKNGKAIIVVDGESVAAPESYGQDRTFVYLRLCSTPDASQDRAVAALGAGGHPVIQIDLDDMFALPQEFFRWEVATAVAGALLKVNPFDQPDVEASKTATRAMMSRFETTGALPAESPVWSGQGVAIYTDARNAEALGTHDNLAGWLRAHLGRMGAGDYLGLLAYVDMDRDNAAALQAIRHQVRDRKGNATCLGFGPRFLHSSGQAYKGGPNSGVFVQLTCEPVREVAVPGWRYGFSVLVGAQARGDLEVLLARERRALRIHLSSDVATGLATVRAAVAEALR